MPATLYKPCTLIHVRRGLNLDRCWAAPVLVHQGGCRRKNGLISLNASTIVPCTLVYIAMGLNLDRYWAVTGTLHQAGCRRKVPKKPCVAPASSILVPCTLVYVATGPTLR